MMATMARMRKKPPRPAPSPTASLLTLLPEEGDVAEGAGAREAVALGSIGVAVVSRRLLGGTTLLKSDLRKGM